MNVDSYDPTPAFKEGDYVRFTGPCEKCMPSRTRIHEGEVVGTCSPDTVRLILGGRPGAAYYLRRGMLIQAAHADCLTTAERPKVEPTREAA